jgi:hypothetical protein
MLAITFAIKTKIRMAAILYLELAVIAVGISFFWGIIPFALLLPAGILA